MHIRSLISTAAVALTAGAALAAMPAHAATEMRVNIFAGPNHAIMTHGYPRFIKGVEADSKGDIKVKMFVGGQLLGAQAMLGGLRDGIADAGFMVLPYWPAQLPISKFIADLGFLGTDGAAMAGAISEFKLLSCPDCVQEFTSQGVVYGGAFATPPYALLTRTKVSTLEEVKGKKLRSGGPLWNRWAAAVGAVPSSVPADDMYDSISRGVLDGTMVSVASLKNYQLWDVTKHVTLADLGTYSGTPASLSLAFWRKLTPDGRRAIINNLAHVDAGTTVGYWENDQEVINAAESKGVKIYKPDASLAKATQDFATKDLAMVVAEASKANVKNAEQKFEAFKALAAKWHKLAPEAAYDHDKLVALFNREIFSKLDASKYGM
ncbi:MAG: C4-dicarboxylate TRAP transporter substrate-binding protein [Alphaproteobacteria bacterium]